MNTLYDFLKTHRTELISRCSAKAAKRNHTTAAAIASEHGIPQFVAQLIETFRVEQTADARARHKALGAGRPSLALVPSDISGSAAKHGMELYRQGLSIDQVVHDYGDMCQALTELALEHDAPITVDEFHTFNRCLDDAIADAVTSFSKMAGTPAPIPQGTARGQPASDCEKIRTVLEVAKQTFAAIQAGQVALNGSTAALHHNSLAELSVLVERAFGNGRSHGESGRAP
ncbi:MAG: hypothetical protein ABI789_09695 [Usitatibacter sp.]